MVTKIKQTGIEDSAVGQQQLEADAVTAGKIVDGAVGSAEIDANAVTASEIAADAVGSSEIAADAVTASEIVADAVGEPEIAADAVTASEIAAGAVGTSEIATDGVGSDEIAAGAVGSSEIGTDAVGSDEIAAGAVGTSEIANASIGLEDLSAAATPVFTKVFTSTAQTITSGGALTIAHGLGAQPKLIQAYIVNVNAEFGYSTGDQLLISGAAGATDTSTDRGMSYVTTATDLVIRYGAAATCFSINRKDTGAVANAVNANWQLLLRAFA